MRAPLRSTHCSGHTSARDTPVVCVRAYASERVRLIWFGTMVGERKKNVRLIPRHIVSHEQRLYKYSTRMHRCDSNASYTYLNRHRTYVCRLCARLCSCLFTFCVVCSTGDFKDRLNYYYACGWYCILRTLFTHGNVCADRPVSLTQAHTHTRTHTRIH